MMKNNYPLCGTDWSTRSLPLFRWTLGAASALLREGSPLLAYNVVLVRTYKGFLNDNSYVV